MKKTKIIGTVFLLIALILEIIPYGIKMKWADQFTKRVTYHSYFDGIVWGYGDIAPLCASVLTVVILIMLTVSIFVNCQRAYTLALSVLSLITVILSIVPVLFDSYTLIGGIITACLCVAFEITVLINIKR